MPDGNVFEKPFSRAEAWDKYLARNEASREGFLQVYGALVPDPDILDFLMSKGPLKILALGETWCPDVIHHFPLLRKLEESVDTIEVRFRSSEAEKELMTWLNPDNKNSIPSIVFMDSDFQELGRVKGRKPMAKEFMMSRIAGRKQADIPKDEVASVLEDFSAMFASKFVEETYEEIKSNLTKQCLI